jgi:hypothetical protein
VFISGFNISVSALPNSFLLGGSSHFRCGLIKCKLPLTRRRRAIVHFDKKILAWPLVATLRLPFICLLGFT